jgi:hypothetical protein
MPSNEAKKLLEPHISTLNEIFMTAWQKIGQIPSELSYPIGSRSRACVMYDYICYEAKHKFSEVAGVSVTDYPNFLVLNFNNLLLMRFKMLDEYLRASNIPTCQQKNYNDQNKQLELPNIPPSATRIIAGYQLDRAQISIKDVIITCPQGNDNIWHFSIFGNGPDASQQVLPIDEPPMNGPKVKAKNIRKTSDE